MQQQQLYALSGSIIDRLDVADLMLKDLATVRPDYARDLIDPVIASDTLEKIQRNPKPLEETAREYTSVYQETVRDYVTSLENLMLAEARFFGFCEAVELEGHRPSRTALSESFAVNAQDQENGASRRKMNEHMYKVLKCPGTRSFKDMKEFATDTANRALIRYRHSLPAEVGFSAERDVHMRTLCGAHLSVAQAACNIAYTNLAWFHLSATFDPEMHEPDRMQSFSTGTQLHIGTAVSFWTLAGAIYPDMETKPATFAVNLATPVNPAVK